MTSENSIKVAVIGGGLAGATLMNALLKHSHIDAEIFESAIEFSERGAAVGIAHNGQAALNEIGHTVADALDRAGAVVMASSRMYMASGPSAMTFVFDLAGKQRGKVVHRAALLGELLKLIPKEKMHTNKKLTRIEDLGNPRVLLHFGDNTTFEADAVIGADGVHGNVRQYVLGVHHPALKPKSAGFWDSRSLITITKAKELLGAKFFEEQRQYGWVGDGGFFMHDVLDGGETVQCVVCGLTDESWEGDEKMKNLDNTTLQQALSSWTETTIKKGMIEAMMENNKLAAYSQWHHEADTPTYTKDHVCIIGDAAHCTTPWQGSGAGQAIEDVMILETLLGEVKDILQLTAAFRAYDQVRRPRAQRIVKSSKETGIIMCGRGVDTGLDVDRFRDALPQRWHFIYALDVKDHKREALEVFRKME